MSVRLVVEKDCECGETWPDERMDGQCPYCSGSGGSSRVMSREEAIKIMVSGPNPMHFSGLGAESAYMIAEDMLDALLLAEHRKDEA